MPRGNDMNVANFAQGQGKIHDPYANMTNAQKQQEMARLKKDQHDTLGRVVNKLQETDRTADKILTGLDDNTAAMKRILEKQDHINENLMKGDKILGNMEGILFFVTTSATSLMHPCAWPGRGRKCDY